MFESRHMLIAAVDAAIAGVTPEKSLQRELAEVRGQLKALIQLQSAAARKYPPCPTAHHLPARSALSSACRVIADALW